MIKISKTNFAGAYYILFGILLLSFGFLVNHTETNAAEYPSYTVKKGRSASVSYIIKNNPITKNLATTTYKNLTFRSKNNRIVKIAGKRLIGKKEGTTFIRGYKNNKKVLSLRVTVGQPVKKVKLNFTSTSLTAGKTKKITAQTFPVKASNTALHYTSSNIKIAKVSKRGKITAIGGGNCKIYVVSKDGHIKRTITIKVKSTLIRQTMYGQVKGKHLTESMVWYGVPYGASTTGQNRWKAPQSPTAWSGVMNTTVQREGAAQYGDGSTSYYGTEDCLYVNIYRPNTATTNLPVMVYLHGGGNATDTSNRNFDAMASGMNCIIVSVEYRLGAFGFLSHPALRTGTDEENSGNFTLLDVKKSLEWVKENVHYFGGNQNNVTLTGYSAGARLAMLCYISPKFQGLFHKVIALSGGGTTCTQSQGETSCEQKLAQILVTRGQYITYEKAYTYVKSATDEEISKLLRSLSTTEIANMYNSPSIRLTKFPQGFNDGVVIPKDGFDVIAQGNYNRVPILLGSNASEFAKYAFASDFSTDGIDTISGTNMLQLLKAAVDYGSELQACHYVEELGEKILQDPLHSNVYGYRFSWGENASISSGFYSTYVGAYHGTDVNFLCGKYVNEFVDYAPDVMRTENAKGRKALTQAMRKYLRSFMVNGNPNVTGMTHWDAWNTTSGANKIMVLKAGLQKNTSVMSTQYLKKSSIFTSMKMNLSESYYNSLINSVFNDRIFMPSVVPTYK